MRRLFAVILGALTACAVQSFDADEDAFDPVEDASTHSPEDRATPLTFDLPSTPEDQVVTPPDLPAALDASAPQDLSTQPQDLPQPTSDLAGPCPLGTVRCGTTCADLSTSPSHCGRCDLACAPGRACFAGFCEEPCAAPRLMCGALCTDPSVDPSHCGRCDNACPAGAVCSAGRCVTRCAAPLSECGGQCVDTRTNPLHCGACGSPCASGSSCSAGRCTTPSGTAGVGAACARNADCQAGWTCQPEVFGWPGGYCSLQGCARDSDCGPAGVCLIGSVRSACFAGCTSATQCRAGYACVRLLPTDPVGLCFPSCVPNVPLVCGEYACNTRTELCTGGCSTSLECSNNSRCIGGDCYCTALTNCGANRRCYTAGGYCGCANDLACGADARCDTVTGDCVGR